jgi:hypothetical protein
MPRFLQFLGLLLSCLSLPEGRLSAANEPFQKMSPQDQWQCLKKNSSTIAASMGEAGTFLNKIFETVESQKAEPVIMGVDNQRVALIQQMGIATANVGGSMYEMRVGPNGEKTHVFRLMKQMTKDLEDREKFNPAVQQVCQNFDSRVADLCVESFWKKLDNIRAFLKRHEAKITEMAENPPSGSETWMDKVGGYTFERDAITDSNLRFGGSVYIGESMMQEMTIPTLFGPISMPLQVTNSSGQPVGSIMPVSRDGEMEYYFAEISSADPIRGNHYLNPFFFIFGTDRSEEWNARFNRFHGGLRVGSMSLEDWIQKQKQGS